MRLYTKEYSNKEVISLMHQLSDSSTDEALYRDTFYKLGQILGMALNKAVQSDYGQTMLACASEDADWLAKGVKDAISQHEVALAVFWNDRVSLVPSINSTIEISPIIKSYIEPIRNCKTLILVKSIVSTSCVIKTQLTALVGDIKPESIYILSPVMYKNASKNLLNEFPESINKLFHFITLAIDDRKNERGEILPGVGGMVYPRLGLGDIHEKNSYIPELLRNRTNK